MKLHLRHVLYHYYKENNEIGGKEALGKINKVYGENLISVSNCNYWLGLFKSGKRSYENIEDEQRSGRPTEIDEVGFWNLTL